MVYTGPVGKIGPKEPPFPTTMASPAHVAFSSVSLGLHHTLPVQHRLRHHCHSSQSRPHTACDGHPGAAKAVICCTVLEWLEMVLCDMHPRVAGEGTVYSVHPGLCTWGWSGTCRMLLMCLLQTQGQHQRPDNGLCELYIQQTCLIWFVCL